MVSTQSFGELRTNDANLCLADSATTHNILKDKKYFSHLTMGETYVNTISGSKRIIEGSGRTNILLPGGTYFIIENALFSLKFHRNLLSFKDIRQNGYHVETANVENIEYLYVTTHVMDEKCVLEKLPCNDLDSDHMRNCPL